MTRRQRDWRRARKPVRPEELTPAMLYPVRVDAARSRLPQTIWPSRFFGRDFVGIDCLLVSSAVGWKVPEDAAPGSEPLLSVLPVSYFDHARQ